MARTASANSNSIRFAFTNALTLADAFTLSFWFKPLNLTQSSKWIWSADKDASNYWALRWEYTADSVDFFASGYGGTNPGTSSAMALTPSDVTNGVWLAYRYNGAGAEWSKWYAGVKSLINATISFTLPTALVDFFAFNNTVWAGTNAAAGDLAELAVWNIGLSDADMADLARGISADQFAPGALQFYAPLRGTFGSVFEKEYTRKRGTLTYTFSATAQATHPSIIAKNLQQKYQPAWVLDVYHTDGTLKAASRDLVEEVDYDVLGDFYPGDIKNPQSIEVIEELSDGGFGLWTPGTVSVQLKPGANYRDVVLQDGPAGYWRMGDSGSTAADETGTNNGGYVGSAHTKALVGAIESDPNQAVRFPGATTDYVTIPHHASLNLSAAVTVEGWVRPRANHQGGIFEKTTAGAVNEQYLLFLSSTSPGFSFRVLKTNVQYTVTDPVPAYGVWYHIVGRYDGAFVRLWVNGREVGTPVALTGALDTGSGVSLIGLLGSSVFPFDGEIDEVAVYPSALSEERIRLHYQVGLQSYKGRFGVGREWRGVHARLRRYDRETHEVTDELSGVIVDADFAGLTLTIGTEDSAALNTMIPRSVVDINSFPSATDLGACIPVIAGSGAFFTPPYIGRDDNGGDDPEARDFCCGFQFDADGTVMPVKIEKVWEDVETDPGLERLTEWITAPGSPAYVSSTRFSVNTDLELNYPAGLSVRFKKTSTGSAWNYTFVASYDATTSPDQVVVSDADLESAGFGSVEIAAGDYLVEKARYAVQSQNLVSIRRNEGRQGAPVVQASNAALANPATVVREILKNTRWGLAEAVNDTEFDAAEAAFSAASLGTGVSAVIGWNRQQRRARDVIRDFLSMRGGRLRKNASTQQWEIEVDGAPTTATLTLGFADGVYNNVVRLRSIRKRTLSDAVQTLRFRFGTSGRVTPKDGAMGSITLISEQYQFFVDADVLTAVGGTLEIANPYVRSAAVARRIAYYMAQSMRASDLGIEVDGGLECRLLRPGDLVRFVAPLHGLDETMRVWRMQRRLTDVGLLLRGYDADAYTFNSALVTDSVDVTDLDEKSRTPTGGTNFIVNGDFSAGLRKKYFDANMVPGFSITDTGARVSSVTITADAKTITNANYLTIVTSSAGGSEPLLTALRSVAGATAGLAVGQTGRNVMASVYADRADGWNFKFHWLDSSGVTISTDHRSLLPVGGLDGTNGLGWRRYFSVDTAPANAVTLYLSILLGRGSGTFKFDGLQLERIARGSHKPTEWKGVSKWGIDPAQNQPGPLTIRGASQPESGFIIQEPVFEEVTLSSGASVNSSASLIPAGALLVSVTGRVTQAITGATSFNVGVSGDVTRFASLIATALNTTWNVQQAVSHVPYTPYGSNTAVAIGANGPNFTGGKVRLMVIYATVANPTS